MKKSVLTSLVVLVLLLSATSASAVTLTGKATPTGTPTYMIEHGPGGLLMINVYWKTKNSLLFLVGACDDGAVFVSGSMQQQFTRVEIEVDPGTNCEVQARSRSGRSKFWINVQGSGIFGTSEELQVRQGHGPSPLLDGLAALGKEVPRR